MKVLIDMNLSPDWVAFLQTAGVEAIHWSFIGKATAEDREIMQYARQFGLVVFTHDLDFGAALALTRADGPSTIQVRTQDITPAAIGPLVLSNFRRFKNELEGGALLVIEESRSRVRILPLKL
jgi:predicted nuclease of predicted toxin-antitoxin system